MPGGEARPGRSLAQLQEQSWRRLRPETGQGRPAGPEGKGRRCRVGSSKGARGWLQVPRTAVTGTRPGEGRGQLLGDGAGWQRLLLLTHLPQGLSLHKLHKPGGPRGGTHRAWDTLTHTHRTAQRPWWGDVGTHGGLEPRIFPLLTRILFRGGEAQGTGARQSWVKS